MADFALNGNPRFEVRRQLGAGGMGIVFEAVDRERGDTVALKTLQHLSPHALYRFKHEFRALQACDHPNLVSLGELIESEGTWFFTMELVEGVDFLEWVKGNHARLRDALGQLVRGLEALHAAGMVHRDIKPTNILVTREGRVVLLDFGLVTETEASGQSSELAVVGTVGYMAPEQAACATVGPEADWYAAGVLLWQALVGRLPFEGAAYKVMLEKQGHAPEPPATLAEGVPPDLSELAVAMLAPSPSARPNGPEIRRRLGGSAGPGAGAGAAATPSVHPSVVTQLAVLLGREAEMARLGELYERSRESRATVAIVEGPSGLGKTTLARRFTRELALRVPEALILHGRCYEREQVPYNAFDAVIDGLARGLRGWGEREVATVLPRQPGLLRLLFPVLGRVESIARAPTPTLAGADVHELRQQAFGALRDLVSRIAEARPLVIAVDDLQWADADSRVLLDELLRAPDAPRVLLVATVRSEVPFGEELPGELHRVRLGPLAPDAARALAAQLLGAAGSPAGVSARDIAEEAGGHPLYIDELVRHAAASDGDGRARRPRLEEAIYERTQKLEPPVRGVLELIAACGLPVPEEIVGEAVAMGPAELGRALALLKVANLTRTARAGGRRLVEPYHDRVREAVLARLDEGARGAMHRRLVAALEGHEWTADHPELLLGHMEAAGDAARAGDHAEAGADRSARTLAFDQAARLYRAALRHVAPGGERARGLQLRLAEALVNAGRGQEAADALLVAAAGAPEEVARECRRRAAEQLLMSGYIERGLEVMSALLAEVGMPLPRSPRRALASLLWSRARIRLRGLKWKERPAADIARADLIRLDLCGSVGQGLGAVDTIRGADFQARGLLQALRVGDPLRVGLALAREAAFVASQGAHSVGRARELLARAERIALSCDDAYLWAWVLAARSLASHFAGDFLGAVAAATDALRKLREETHGHQWERTTVESFRIGALRQLGRFGEARDILGRTLRDAASRGDRYTETTMGRLGAYCWLAEGNPDRVERELREARWAPPGDTFHVQHWYELETRVELALYRGEAVAAVEATRDAFLALRRSLLPRVQIVRTIADWLEGRLLLAAGRDHDRVLRLAAALEGESVPHAGVYVHLLRAGVAHARGDGAACVEGLRAALRLSEERHMLWCAAAARLHLADRVGGRTAEAMRAEALRWMASEDVADPGRLAEVVAPGFAPVAVTTGAGS